MYRKHFALSTFPFDVTPQPDALFASAALGEAEARLTHLLELRAVGLVTGEAGSPLVSRTPAMPHNGRALPGRSAVGRRPDPAGAGHFFEPVIGGIWKGPGGLFGT